MNFEKLKQLVSDIDELMLEIIAIDTKPNTKPDAECRKAFVALDKARTHLMSGWLASQNKNNSEGS